MTWQWKNIVTAIRTAYAADNEETEETTSAPTKALSTNDGDINNNKSDSSFPDRSHDTASLTVMFAFCFLWFVAVLVALAVPLVALAWTGLGTLLLIQNTHFASNNSDTASKHGHMLTFCLMVAFMALSLIPWHPIRFLLAVLAGSIILLQAALLAWTLHMWSPSETSGQRAFYAALHVLGTLFTIISMWNIFASFLTWPSAASFNCSVASFLVFAYASWLGSKATGVVEHPSGDHFVFSCSNGSPDFSVFAVLALLLHFPTVFIMVSGVPSGTKDPLTLLLLTMLFVFGALFLQWFLFVPIRLYVRSDACIVVQFLRTSYVYGKAVRVYGVPATSENENGDAPSPTNTDTCHVYALNKKMKQVMVQLTEEKSLVLTPQLPDEFVSAVTRTIEHPERTNEQQKLETA